jgi:ribosomal protein S18 acetylase RimI-like enzyme
LLPKTINLRNGTSIILRHLSKEDLNDIWNIFNEVVEEKQFIPVINPVTSRFEKENWYFRQKDEDNIVVVAEIDNHIVGQCMIEHTYWDASAHVGDLGIIIAAHYRNFGLGQYLIQEALKVARDKAFEKICLSCFHTNIRALNLYKRIGFQKVGLRERQFKMDGKIFDEVLMELWLKDLNLDD